MPLPQDAPQGYCPRCLAGLAAGVASKLIDDQPSGTAPGGSRTVRYFGDYELIAEVASGGMGVVYRARQISLNRVVALKMIRAGQFASPAEVQRFRTEAEAAANLDHPNIVPIYEVGEHEGRHYFSMKLVEGGSLAERISDFKSEISNQQAASLIATLARAVHHAHQRGVLHRDLKPTNILIDDRGEPHLTDFGLAKLVHAGGDLTQTIAILGTPHYMAPEQAAGKTREVTTAADVYSLGAILYELLAGRTPFQGESALEVLQQAQNREPDSPRKFNRAIDRDLETICLKCLEKEPSRRYGSAEKLADDLEHWLAGEPIQARPVKPPERVFKWARRNPALATLVVLAHLLFAAGLGGVLWQWQRAEANAGRAERNAAAEASQRRKAEANERLAEIEAARSAQVARFMKEMLAGVGPSVALGRDTTLLREILDKTAERVNTDLQGQPAVAAELQSTLGNVYLQLSEFDKAEAAQLEALRLRRSLFGETNEWVAASLNDLARVLINCNQAERLPEAEGILHQTLVMRRQLLGEEHADTALSLYLLAAAQQRQQKFDLAEAAHREALAIRRKLFGNEHLDVAGSLNNLARLLTNSGRHGEAEKALREALAIQRKLLGSEHPNISDTLHTLIAVLKGQDRVAETEAVAREALAMRRRFYNEAHPGVITLYTTLADLLVARGEKSECEFLLRESIRLQRELLGNDHPQIASTLHNLGNLLNKAGKPVEAEKAFREALAMRRDVLKLEDRGLSDTLVRLAQTLERQNKLPEAEALYREELALERRLSGEDHPWAANSLITVGKVLNDQGKYLEAEQIFREALAIRRKHLGPEHASVADTLAWLGHTLHAQQRLGEAEAAYREALKVRKKTLGGEHLDVATTAAQLTRLLLEQEKFAEAEAPARECLILREKLLPDHWLTFNSRSVLGACLLGAKSYAEAEPLLLSGYEGMKQREEQIPASVRAIRLKEALERLVQYCEATDESGRASEWRRKLAEVEQTAQR